MDYNSLSYSEGMDYILKFDGKEFVAGGDIDARNKRLDGQHAKQGLDMEVESIRYRVGD